MMNNTAKRALRVVAFGALVIVGTLPFVDGIGFSRREPTVEGIIVRERLEKPLRDFADAPLGSEKERIMKARICRAVGEYKNSPKNVGAAHLQEIAALAQQLPSEKREMLDCLTR